MSVRILIIEDHADNLELMRYLLAAFGYETMAAENGLDGVEMIERERPDLIICDIQIPGIDGYEVARRVKSREELRPIPVVAITALAMVGDRDRVLDAGFDGYIPKPIAPATFLSEVEVFLPRERRLSHRAPPQAATAVSAPMRTSEVAGAPSRRRGIILAVDNNRSNLELAQSLFEPYGYTVLTASDGIEALAMAKRGRPDLILSDVSMPEHSGYELAKAVKTDPDLKGTPVILISSSRAGDGKVALAAGASKFLTRPIDPAILLREVEKCLRQKAATQR
jgi:CheY-like chemotaxis protein